MALLGLLFGPTLRLHVPLAAAAAGYLVAAALTWVTIRPGQQDLRT